MMRPVPGQLGGGLGRVVEVRDLPGSRTSSGGLRTVQAVLEKSAAPLQREFSDVLAQFNGDDKEAAAPSIPLSTTVVTTVQEYSAAMVPPVAATVPTVTSPAAPEDDQTETARDKTTAQTADEKQKSADTQDKPDEQTQRNDFLKDLLPALGETPKAAIYTPTISSFVAPSTQMLNSNNDLFSRMRLAASAYAGQARTAPADAQIFA